MSCYLKFKLRFKKKIIITAGSKEEMDEMVHFGSKPSDLSLKVRAVTILKQSYYPGFR